MRATCLILSILLLMLIVPVATAAEQLFSQLDQNQDGWLEQAEIETQHHRLFQRLLRTADGDRDGRLSSAEFLTGLQPQSPAKPLVKKEGSELPGTDALLLLLAMMDVNTNGRIEATEVPQQFVEIFKRIEDRLGGERDGVLDRRELTQAAPALSQIAQRITQRMDLDVEVELALLSEQQWQSVQEMIGPRRRGDLLADPQQAREYFRRLDANGDGQITPAEVPQQLAERFEQLLERADRNRDDQISEQELMTISRQMQAMADDRPTPAQLQQGIERLLKRLDRNGDQKISRVEAPRRMASRFDRIDTNGSSQLERDELAPVVEMLSRLRKPEAKSQNASDAKIQPKK